MKLNTTPPVVQHERSLRARGIGYDTGFRIGGTINRPFDRALVRRELQIIHDDLHCNAVRLIGNDLERLEFAARHAADLGLEIWFSPYPMELDPEEVLKLLADAAERAEQIRRRGAAVVFVTGAELSLFNSGFLPGNSPEERVGPLLRREPGMRELVAEVPARINDFLARAVVTVRERFGGKVTYASIPFEGVDWTPFDIVSVDAHRTKEVAHIYQQGIHALVAQGKPVAITEFGCATHRGAGDRGGRGGSEMIEYEGSTPVRLNGNYIRDEQEQATHLRELLDIFTTEGVDAAFVCTFVCYGWPHRSDPREDLDMASWGVVKVLEGRSGDIYSDVPWEPKAAFTALADFYHD
ncbi:MAG TPA: hypothetical protein VHZ51_02960 [Ktedonobacteraceae bacterium]|jgi:hypothetical protein|nr:hypothetical protein [Ktedonobacteraceae bacterium]